MCDASAVEISDLIEVDLGPRARGYFTTRGLRARPVSVPNAADTGVGPPMTGGTWRSMSETTHNVFIVTVVDSRICWDLSRGGTWPG